VLAKMTDLTTDIKEADLTAFEFDWTRKSCEESVIYGATVADELAGLVEFERVEKELYYFMHLIEVAPVYRGTSVAGELLAFIGKNALENGCDGFVVFESKSLLYAYYIDKYGAKPLKGRRLHFDEAATRRLIRVYLEVNYTRADLLKPPTIVSESRNVTYAEASQTCPRCAEVIAKGDAHIQKYGHGVIPNVNRNELTGLRYIPAIEAKLGRQITDREWDNMSIR